MMAVKRIKHDDMMEVTWGKRVAIDRQNSQMASSGKLTFE